MVLPNLVYELSKKEGPPMPIDEQVTGPEKAPIDTLVRQLCPSWNLVVPRSAEDFFEEIRKSSGASGYTNPYNGDVVDFSPSDVRIKSSSKVCRRGALNDVRDWAKLMFSEYNVIGDDEFVQLEALAGVSGVSIRLVELEGTLKYCGEVTQGFLRVHLRGDDPSRDVCISPQDVIWETFCDKTFDRV
jgi:hypothetical protein